MRSIFSVFFGALWAFGTVSAAGAGGWAITTLDEVPASFAAGTTYRVGFTVLQHGIRPAEDLDASIRIQESRSGQRVEFPARPEGAVGHYVAEVRFPSSGAWTWEVGQGWYAPQAVGAVTVSDPALIGATSSSVVPPRLTGMSGAVDLGPWRGPLAVASAASVLLFAFSLQARRRSTSAA